MNPLSAKCSQHLGASSSASVLRVSVRLVWACVFKIVLRFRFGCFRFSLGFLLRFTSACVVIISVELGWLGGVCLVSIQSCCSVSLVLVFFREVLGSMG